MQVTKMLGIEQGTPEWHAWRGGLKFSASRAAAWLGESPYREDTPRRCALEMLGLAVKKDLSNNPHVRRGNEQEEKVREMIGQLYGRFIVPHCVERIDRPYVIASLDGVDGEGEIWEFKSPGIKAFTRVWEALQADQSYPGPPEYLAQLDHQLVVCKDFARFNNLVLKLSDEELEKAPQERRAAFSEPLLFRRVLGEGREDQLLGLYDTWHGHLLGGQVLPEPDPARDVFTPDESNVMLLAKAAEALRIEERLVQLNAQVKLLEAEQEGHVAAIKEAMGDYSACIMPNGIKVTLFPRRGNVDAKAALASVLPPETDLNTILEQFRGKTTQQSKVTYPKSGKAPTKLKAA